MNSMKILHLMSNLPDHRVEKAAYLLKKEGHEIYFAGYVPKDYKPPTYDSKLFTQTFNVEISPRNKLGIDLNSIIAELTKICDEQNIDVIHASNIYCANIADKLNRPVVFDDREFYSYELQYISARKTDLKNRLAHILMKKRYPRMEKQIIKKWPIVTVSKEIIELYKKIDPDIRGYYFPNMPLLEEVQEFEPKAKQNKKLLTMYVGLNDFSNPISYRNTAGLVELWNTNEIGELVIIGDKNYSNSKNVTNLGFIKQKEVFRQLLKGHVGLIGWIPHTYHHICSLNKIFNYIHTGLEPVYPQTLTIGKEISELYQEKLGEKFGFEFKNFSEIKDYLLNNMVTLLNRDSTKINKIARENFVLNIFKDNLINAYKEAIEN